MTPDDAPPLTDARLVHLAAQVLALVTATRSMLQDEHAEQGAPRERRAIAAVALGRVDLATAYRVPLFALTGAPRLLLWTAASKALRVRRHVAAFVFVVFALVVFALASKGSPR